MTSVVYRAYDSSKDHEAAQRIGQEVGWLQKGEEEAWDLVLAAGERWVAELDGAAECVVTTSPGTIRYLAEELRFGFVAAVMTSRIARKQGFAGRLTAHAIASLAHQGALVAGLDVFDQGYYDHLGFGTTCYEHVVAFDPAHLQVPVKPRVPRRLTADDWPAVHASRLARRLQHGSCSIALADYTHANMLFGPNAFGLGYFDGPAGELTHHMWIRAENAGRGPYRLEWMVYQNREQFLELMALLKSLDDQVYQVILFEPPNVQLQDLIRQPFRQRRMSDKSAFEMSTHANAIWQMRICDLPGCLKQTHLNNETTRFNLSLSDPIERYLDAGSPWRGAAGEYVVTLGPTSCAETGHDPALPTLETSVSAFTRLWLGVRPATGLAMTDSLDAPVTLLQRLDQTLCLPQPMPDWTT